MTNEFIILVERYYDCYTVDMPYPLITEKTKDEIENELQVLASKIVVNGMVTKEDDFITFMNVRIRRNNFQGDIIGNKPIDGHYRFKKRIPAVLTFQEWNRSAYGD